jgi:hypothetical protein
VHADESLFVSGKPLTDIWGPAGLRWLDTLRAHINGPLRNPYLVFARLDRAQYDLDNLVYPVLAATGNSACESVWATVTRSEPEGVFISEAVPPPPPHDSPVVVYIAHPSTSSVRDRAAVAELREVEPFGVDEPLALALQFDSSAVAVG